MHFERSAGAILFRVNPKNQIEYLLLKHNENYWNFPKGKLDKGEGCHNAAIREIQEETGLINLKYYSDFKLKTRYFFRAPERNLEWTFKIVTFYLAEAENPTVNISDEHQGYQWLRIKEALEKVKNFRQIQKIIIKADDYISKAKEK